MDVSFEHLNLVINDQGIQRLDGKNFFGNILNSGNYKIYILKDKSRYLYVGKTKQKIGTKFGQGFRSYKKDKEGKREGAYGGYKWIKEFINTGRTIELYVFDLGEFCSNNNAEAIEAEIVFIIREQFNLWPECQNEIHFNNNFRDATKEAKEIFGLTK